VQRRDSRWSKSVMPDAARGRAAVLEEFFELVKVPGRPRAGQLPGRKRRRAVGVRRVRLHGAG